MYDITYVTNRQDFFDWLAEHEILGKYEAILDHLQDYELIHQHDNLREEIDRMCKIYFLERPDDFFTDPTTVSISDNPSLVGEYQDVNSVFENYEEKYDKLSDLVAKLREVFPFPPEKDWDNGYPWDKEDGWHLGGIIHDPEMCLEIMISVLKGQKVKNDKDSENNNRWEDDRTDSN